MFSVGKVLWLCSVFFGEVVHLPFNVAHGIGRIDLSPISLNAFDGGGRVVLGHTGRYYESISNVRY